MNKIIRSLSAVVLLMSMQTAVVANTQTSVTDVSSAVTVAEGVDYVITSANPFAAGGEVSISGTSTLILKHVIPSAALKLASHIKIDGQAAVNGTNCMFKVYGGGTIVLPHGRDIQPFVAYTGENLSGDSKAFSVGARLSLAGNAINNRIESFTLKRGYMVCLDTKANGKGYSRIYIADTDDREVRTLPFVLKDKISSIRVMQWNDCGKRGYSGGDPAVLDALNASWYYDWNCGGVATADWEYVPQHHHEGWPSIADIGSSSHSPHALANNEPDNTGDAREQVNTVEEVLASWPEMMATGKRLGSPAMSGNMNWLYAFIDSIDARGWRCDFIAMHCYWYSDWSSWQSNLANIARRTGRPIWITEMNYGANWTGWPSQDRSGSAANFDIEKQHFAPVIDGLEASDWLERYAVYNWVEDCRSMYLNGQLTPMGRYYAEKETQVGYNASKEKVPSLPRQYNPSNLKASYDKNAHLVTLEWHDKNGEYNRSMEVQQQLPGSSSWTTVLKVEPQENEADYSMTVDGRDGYAYRVRVVDINNRERLTNVATAVNDNLVIGDEVSVGNTVMYLGGNRLLNGNFDFGLLDWTTGAGTPLSSPSFQVLSFGGIDGGSYLQCYGGSDEVTSEASLRKRLILETDATYYVSVAGCHNDPNKQRVSTTLFEKVETNVHLRMPSVSQWTRQGSTFKVDNDTIFLIQFRGLAGVAQFDDMQLCRLFPTREEALADALEWERARVALFKSYNTTCSVLNDELDAILPSATASQLQASLSLSLQALRAQAAIDSIMPDAELVQHLGLSGANQVGEAITSARTAHSAQEYVSALASLREAMDGVFAYRYLSGVIASADFSGRQGWNLISGTYKGGDQRTATQAGKTCWNAWWNIPAGEGQNMAIDQTIMKLPQGLYALECKATTEHLCVTDQHAFLTYHDSTICSPLLDEGVLDLPGFSSSQTWRSLVTPYVYVDAGDTITIGFTGTKQGAVDNAWRRYGDPTHKGDCREGWWCATDFALRYIPLTLREADTQGWGTICLASAFDVPSGVTLYQVEGILRENHAICLKEATVIEAGEPYIFHAEAGAEIVFLEHGESVEIPNTDANGLRGALDATSRYPVGALVLEQGKWRYIPDAASRYRIVSYSAYIQKVDNLPVLDAWTGVTLPTSGIEDVVLSLSGVKSDAGVTSPAYNAAGQRVDGSAQQGGIIIQQGVKSMR